MPVNVAILLWSPSAPPLPLLVCCLNLDPGSSIEKEEEVTLTCPLALPYRPEAGPSQMPEQF